MSLHLPSRRVVRAAASLATSKTPLTLQYLQRRTFWGQLTKDGFEYGKRESKDNTIVPKNPLTEQYLKKKPKQPGITKGDLAPSSIFEDEALAGPKPRGEYARSKDKKEKKRIEFIPRNPDYMAAALDPDPASRRRWERKMVIRDIKKRGRMTKVQILKRTERQLISKSHDFKTSVKKLVPLAKQITGKTIDEAILQMRFSRKKVAKDVKEHLQHAKNEAIVRRGMGLGPEMSNAEQLRIQTNKGKRVKVENLTTMYIEQAWCGKGLYGRTPDYRARGNVHMMKNRTTGLTVILKEEKTRVRLHNERLEKEKNRKVWVQLPNRPITAQRQHYSW